MLRQGSATQASTGAASRHRSPARRGSNSHRGPIPLRSAAPAEWIDKVLGSEQSLEAYKVRVWVRHLPACCHCHNLAPVLLHVSLVLQDQPGTCMSATSLIAWPWPQRLLSPPLRSHCSPQAHMPLTHLRICMRVPHVYTLNTTWLPLQTVPPQAPSFAHTLHACPAILPRPHRWTTTPQWAPRMPSLRRAPGHWTCPSMCRANALRLS